MSGVSFYLSVGHLDVVFGEMSIQVSWPFLIRLFVFIQCQVV